MVLGGHDSGWQSLRTSEIYDLQVIGPQGSLGLQPLDRNPAKSLACRSVVRGVLHVRSRGDRKHVVTGASVACGWHGLMHPAPGPSGSQCSPACCFGGGSPILTFPLPLPVPCQSNRWDAGPVLPSIMTPALSFVGCAVINSDLYAIGGSSFYSPVAVYNHRQGVWSSCAPLQMPRVNMAVASCCGSLFAIGYGCCPCCPHGPPAFCCRVGRQPRKPAGILFFICQV